MITYMQPREPGSALSICLSVFGTPLNPLFFTAFQPYNVNLLLQPRRGRGDCLEYTRHTHIYIPNLITSPVMARGQWNPAGKGTKVTHELTNGTRSERLSKRKEKRREEVVGIGCVTYKRISSCPAVPPHKVANNLLLPMLPWAMMTCCLLWPLPMPEPESLVLLARYFPLARRERKEENGKKEKEKKMEVVRRAASHTSRETWPWNCESPKERECPEGRPKHTSQTHVVVWSRILKW